MREASDQTTGNRDSAPRASVGVPVNTAALLEGHARRSPQRPAYIFDDRATSFAELDARANRVARAFAESGIGKADRVAVYAGNRPEWLEVFFGLAKIGAVLVPISGRLRAGELLHISAHACPAMIVYEGELRDQVGVLREQLPPTTRFVQIGPAATEGVADYDELLARAADGPASSQVDLADLHSVCYTSGTTGAPKGALLTHANVVIGTHRMSASSLGYSGDDVFLNPAPLAHRGGWARLIQSVGVGAPHVLMRRFDPERLLQQIERHAVTIVGVVPTMLRMIAESPAVGRYDSSSLKTILAMGEPCPPWLRERTSELFPRAGLVTVFASTEAGLIAMLPARDQLRLPDAAGRPFDGVELRILADDGSELPPGQPGEIAVRTGEPGTVGVMLGYLDDPVANATSFSDGWYRTGDGGYLDDEGYLHLTDRKKDMILSGGLNIFSREVEEALLQHPEVRDAAVVGVPDPMWGESVVAVVVRRPGSTIDAPELIDHCRRQLASYKKPSRVIFVERLPRNAVGKVLKYRLREQLDNRPEAGFGNEDAADRPERRP